MLVERDLISLIKEYAGFDNDDAKAVLAANRITTIVSESAIVRLAQAACYMEALGCDQNLDRAEKILLSTPEEFKYLANPLKQKLIEIFWNLANAGERSYRVRADRLSASFSSLEPVVTSSGYGSRAMR